MTTIVVMAKAPIPGRVKTRLTGLLGPDGCARLQAALIRHTSATAASVAGCWVAVDPPDALTMIAAMVPAGTALVPQRGDTLGARMAAAVSEAFTAGCGPVVVVGADAPTMTPGDLEAAFGALAEGADVVLGPAVDGGYWLIGLSRPQSQLFALPEELWGGNGVLMATLERAEGANLTVELLAVKRDLDTPADAAALVADGGLPEAIADLLAVNTC